MRTVAEHLAAVLEGVEPLEPVDLPLLEARGLVLAQDVVAPWPLPSVDNSSMDGYAVHAADVAAASESSPASLPVVGDLAAGASSTEPVSAGTCVRIMTGAPMPPGADAVVPVELTDGGTEHVVIRGAVARGAYVRRAGDDVPSGATVARAGDVLTERNIAVIASVGAGVVSVVRRPKLIVISTGDELVDAGEPLEHGQIVDSNGVMLTALALAAGANALRAPRSRDDAIEFQALVEAAVELADVVVTSGGVSMGAYDTVKAVLSQTGDVEFVKVAQQPGMPQGTGRLGSRRVPIVTLPGNPVSSFVSFEVYVRPLVRRLLGHTQLVRQPEPAIALEGFSSPAGKQQYARGVLSLRDDGTREVRPIGGQASHIMGGLAGANALVVVPPEVTRVEAGDVVTVIDLDRSAP